MHKYAPFLNLTPLQSFTFVSTPLIFIASQVLKKTSDNTSFMISNKQTRSRSIQDSRIVELSFYSASA